MATVPVRKFDVSGTDAQVALVQKALDRCHLNPAKLLAARVRVDFTHDMPLRSDGGPAEAYAWLSQRRIGLRPGLGGQKTQARFLHEVGHFVDADHLTAAKRRDLMQLMVPVPETWRSGGYRALPSECFADSFPEMVSDIETDLDSWYTRNIPDRLLPEALAVVLRVDEVVVPPADGPDADPVPEPDPDTEPLPEVEPQGPVLRDLMDQIRQIESSGILYNQNPTSGASGWYGFMPRNWRITAPQVLGTDPLLAVASKSLRPQLWLPELTSENQEAVATREFKRLSRRFAGAGDGGPGDHFRYIAAAWAIGEGSVDGVPISEWPRHWVKYSNSAVVPLGFPAVALPPKTSPEPEDPDPVPPDVLPDPQPRPRPNWPNGPVKV